MKKWLAASILPFLLLSCKTKDLEYLSFERFKVVKMGFPNTRVSVDVTCYNPNRFGGKLLNLDSEVFIDDAYLGKASIDSAIEVPRKDTFLIPVQLEIKTGATLNGLLKMMTQPADSIPVGIRLEGKARLKKGGVIINYPIKYNEKKVLNL